jgi:hypothetical protein
MLRSDGALVLKGYLAAIGQQLRQGKDQPTFNCIAALAKMRPAIDPEAAGI